jgi:hypothetical protein
MNRDFFENPLTDPEYSVSGFWFWNDWITDEKTTEQLDIMKGIGANQPVVHSRFGLQNEYLSQDWFDRIKSVIGVSKKNNQKIWLYDENNWPSGNCSWTITLDEKYREHYLYFEKFQLKEGELVDIDLTGKDYINITVFTEQGMVSYLEKSDLTRFHYNAKGNELVIAVYVAVDDYEPVGKLCVDYLSKEAILKFIESTHQKYYEQMGEEFGKSILGIFMDETRFCNAMPWTETLLEEFKNRKGYDLIPYLPLLIYNDKNSELIRFDYYDVISDLYIEATFKQVFDWCNEHNLKTIGHFLGEETLATQAYFGGDMMRGYQYFHVPGIDHLGNGIGSLDGKFAVSACHNYGKMRIACEAFGASGWDITYEDMVRISNWLFQQGVNLIIMHGFYYSIRDERSEDFPPSYFYQWKYWDHMPTYVKMANRMMETLSNGRSENEILIYAPMETYWKHVEHDLDTKTGFWEKGPWIKDEKAKFIDNQYQLLCNKLIDRNYDFTIFGSDVVKNFKIEGKELVNVLSGERFRVFILPLTEMLTVEVVTMLNQFMEAGGIVISYESDIKHVVSKDGGHMRGDITEVLNLDKIRNAMKLSEIIDICKQEIPLPFEIVTGVDEVSHSLSSYPSRLIDPYIHNGERLYGIGVTRYLKGNERILNFTNYNMKDEDLTIRVTSTHRPEIYIPETGDILKTEAKEISNKCYEFDFTIPANRTYFIVCQL